MNGRDKVKAWIEDHFDLQAVKLEPFPLLPAGCRVIDRNGDEILVYYDILTDTVQIQQHE